MKLVLFFILLLISFSSYSQNRNSIWCFGDSALIDFSDVNNPITGYSGVRSRGSCASIADNDGKLLFYAQTYFPFTQIGLPKHTLVLNKNHQLMENGDSIVGQNAIFELLIINNPAKSSEYYLFSIGVLTPSGVFYSIIDMNENYGLGKVISKNNQLAGWETSDCINAVKHANGIDWWIIIRKGFMPGPTSEFISWLITSNGITGPFVQNIGITTWSNVTHLQFSPDGKKLAMVHLGDFQVFDFDRCTGQLLNPITIDVDANDKFYFSAEFSATGRYLYAIRYGSPNITNFINYLYQYDLDAPDIAASRITIDTFQIYLPSPQQYTVLKRAPDNKIYLTTRYINGYDIPFADSVYNYINMNLSVINNPDEPGLACNFSRFSFYLGGKRTYWGLPNNPDYELGPDVAQPANAGSDTTICTNGSIKLGIPANNISTYSWYPAVGLDNANIAQPTANPTQDTWYYLTVTDTTKSPGCNETRDSVFVKVINCEETEIIIPNVITPNNDSRNDIFEIKNLPVNSSLSIFNRWGNEIYKIDDYKNDWPVNGISAGVYFYILKINGEEEVRKGTVTVLR